MSSDGSAAWAVRLYKQDFRFDAAHFLVFGDGTREPLHGHNYQVRVLLEGEIGPDDLVVDFLAAKPLIRAACAELDHLTLLPTRNRFLRVEQDGARVRVSGSGEPFDLPAADTRLMDLSNVSVERLAAWMTDRILERFACELPTAKLTAIEVEVEETPGQSALHRRALRYRG
jgi:6-pyruvoyltetrahydropterin/6-carboxytetrahydropterin synthase